MVKLSLSKPLFVSCEAIDVVAVTVPMLSSTKTSSVCKPALTIIEVAGIALLDGLKSPDKTEFELNK